MVFKLFLTVKEILPFFLHLTQLLSLLSGCNCWLVTYTEKTVKLSYWELRVEPERLKKKVTSITCVSCQAAAVRTRTTLLFTVGSYLAIKNLFLSFSRQKALAVWHAIMLDVCGTASWPCARCQKISSSDLHQPCELRMLGVPRWQIFKAAFWTERWSLTHFTETRQVKLDSTVEQNIVSALEGHCAQPPPPKKITYVTIPFLLMWQIKYGDAPSDGTPIKKFHTLVAQNCPINLFYLNGRFFFTYWSPFLQPPTGGTAPPSCPVELVKALINAALSSRLHV